MYPNFVWTRTLRDEGKYLQRSKLLDSRVQFQEDTLSLPFARGVDYNSHAKPLDGFGASYSDGVLLEREKDGVATASLPGHPEIDVGRSCGTLWDWHSCWSTDDRIEWFVALTRLPCQSWNG